MTWRERAEALHHRLRPKEWSDAEAQRYLISALCGEAGELANLACKGWRGEGVDPRHVADELADVAIYTHLAARALGLDLDAICDAKTRDNDARFFDHGGPS